MAKPVIVRIIEKSCRKYPTAKPIAVENFLSTARKDVLLHGHQINVNLDSRIYKWNEETKSAIIYGLNMMVDLGLIRK